MLRKLQGHTPPENSLMVDGNSLHPLPLPTLHATSESLLAGHKPESSPIPNCKGLNRLNSQVFSQAMRGCTETSIFSLVTLDKKQTTVQEEYPQCSRAFSTFSTQCRSKEIRGCTAKRELKLSLQSLFPMAGPRNWKVPEVVSSCSIVWQKGSR